MVVVGREGAGVTGDGDRVLLLLLLVVVVMLIVCVSE